MDLSLKEQQSGRNLLREASGLAGVRVALRFTGVLVGLVVARVLGPDGLGLLSIPNLILALGPFLGLGFVDGLARELPRADSGAEAEGLRSAGWSVTLLAAGTFLLVSFPLWFVFREKAALPLLMLLALLAAMMNGAYKFVYTDLVGRREVRALGELQLLQGLARAGLVLALLFLLPSAFKPISLHLGAGVSFLLCITWYARRKHSLPAFRLGREHLKKLLQSGPGLAFASMAIVLLVTGDRMILRPLLNHSEMGLFEQAVLIRDALLLLPAVLLTLLLPDYAGRIHDPSLATDVRRQTLTMAVISPLFLLGLSLQVEWVTGLLLPEFLPGVALYRLTCLAMMPVFIAYIPLSLLMAQNRSLHVALSALAGLALAAVIHFEPNLLFKLGLVRDTPRMFLAGIASLAGLTLFALSISLAVRKSLQLSLSGILLIAIALAACITLGLWLPVVGLGAPTETLIWLMITVVVIVLYQLITGQPAKLWRARRSQKKDS